jgi:hypothetical protein
MTKPEPKELTFGEIEHAKVEFMIQNHREPSYLLINPSDSKYIVDSFKHMYSVKEEVNLIKFSGLYIVRSMDIKEGEWIVC